MHLSTNLFLAVVGGLAVNAAPAPMMRALVGALALGAGAQQPIINNQVVDPAVAAPVGGHHNVWAGNPLHVPAGHPDNVWIGDNNNYAVPQVDFSKYTGATGTIGKSRNR